MMQCMAACPQLPESKGLVCHGKIQSCCVRSFSNQARLLNGHKRYASDMRQLVSKAQHAEDGGRVCALLDVAVDGPFLLLRVLRQHRREQRQVAGAVLRDRGRQVLER